jgi:hypothetical protein
MGNIKNFNFNKLGFKLSNDDFWDFYLANDESSRTTFDTDCLISMFDFNDVDIFVPSASTIVSLISWSGGTNTGYTFDTFGLTGVDNGRVIFEKTSGDTSNLSLLSALTGTTLVVPSGDTRLYLHPVSGSTNQYIYPIDIVSGTSGNYAQFNGGFYQGYYKIDGSSYEVLPNRVNKGWVAEFWVKKDDVSTGYTGTTLNDSNPNNKGFFFYLGTRAENKFWNNFSGLDTGCTSGCTVDIGCFDTLSEWCTIPKESDVVISGDTSIIGLPPNQVIQNEITNQFLIYGRAGRNNTCNSCGASDGLGKYTVCSYTGQTIYSTTPRTIATNLNNPFLVYGRAGQGNTCNSCGASDGFGRETVCSFSGFESSIQYENLDYKLDVIDNSLGFRVKDDGSIGYRMLSLTGVCSGETYISGVSITEDYSVSGLVESNVWTSIIIRFSTDYMDDCDLLIKPSRKGKLMFYINGKLKFIVDDFDEFIAKRLNEYQEKQVGVPFNISLGGGSQGLIETQTFDGRDPEDLGLLIETYFAGSFAGGISTFKFNNCDLYYDEITNIYLSEKNRYQ